MDGVTKRAHRHTRISGLEESSRRFLCEMKRCEKFLESEKASERYFTGLCQLSTRAPNAGEIAARQTSLIGRQRRDGTLLFAEI